MSKVSYTDLDTNETKIKRFAFEKKILSQFCRIIEDNTNLKEIEGKDLFTELSESKELKKLSQYRKFYDINDNDFLFALFTVEGYKNAGIDQKHVIEQKYIKDSKKNFNFDEYQEGYDSLLRSEMKETQEYIQISETLQKTDNTSKLEKFVENRSKTVYKINSQLDVSSFFDTLKCAFNVPFIVYKKMIGDSARFFYKVYSNAENIFAQWKNEDIYEEGITFYIYSEKKMRKLNIFRPEDYIQVIIREQIVEENQEKKSILYLEYIGDSSLSGKISDFMNTNITYVDKTDIGGSFEYKGTFSRYAFVDAIFNLPIISYYFRFDKKTS